MSKLEQAAMFYLVKAVALLRECAFGNEHVHETTCKINAPRVTGFEKWDCDCGTWELDRKIDAFLKEVGSDASATDVQVPET